MIDRIGLAYGIGMVAGMCLVILFLASAIVLLGIQNRIKSKKFCSIELPEKIDKTKTKNAEEASCIKGWNDCVEKL